MSDIFMLTCKSLKLPTPVAEYRFCKERRWRIDYAFPLKYTAGLAIELEGGIWLGSKGGHTSGVGYSKNMEKYNALTELGWHLLRYQPTKVDYEQIARVYWSLKGIVSPNPKYTPKYPLKPI